MASNVQAEQPSPAHKVAGRWSVSSRWLAVILTFPFHELTKVLMKSTVISSNPKVMGGTPVFRGTRVPVQTLVDYLEGGESISDFLEGFPTVTKEQVITFLEEAKEKVLAEFQNSPG